MQFLVSIHSITLVFLPLYIIRFSIFNIPFTLLEVFLLTSIISTLIYFWREKSSLIEFKSKFDLPILLFLTAAIISLYTTPYLLGGLGIFKAYILEPILFFYSLNYVGKKVGSINFILKGLFGSVLIVAILGLIQKLTGQFIFAEHEFIQGRITAFYNSANSLALFIGPIIPLIIVTVIKSKKIWKKFFGFGVVLFLSIIMYWTKSRGGMIAEIGSLSLVFFGIFSQKIIGLKKILLVLPIGFLIISGLFFWQVHKLYAPTIRDGGIRIESDTLQIRYATWQSTLDLLSDRIITGTGLNGFVTIYQNYKLTDFPEDYQYPHMLVLNFWTEMGILGVISFIVLLFYCYIALLLLNKHTLNLFSLGLIGSFAYILLHGLVDVPYFKNDLSLQFWSLLALVELIKLKASS